VPDGDWEELKSFAEELAAEGDSDVATVLSRSKEALGRCCLHFAANFGHAEMCANIIKHGVRYV
jgi:hypothetical protein